MSVEIEKTPGVWGKLKEIAVGLSPNFYTAMRALKNEAAGFSPRVVEKEVVGGIKFKIVVAGWKDRALVEGAAFEGKLLQEMLPLIEEGDIVVDVGAAIGTHSLPSAMKTGPTGIVYSFEPDRQLAEALAANAALNSLENITVLPTALWQTNTHLVLHTSGRRGESPQVREAGKLPDKRFRHHLPIKARSLKSLVDSGIVKSPNIIKIDVEGAGEKVLEGMGDLKPRHIFIEVHPLFGENSDKIKRMLEEKDYKLISETPKGSETHLHFAL